MRLRLFLLVFLFISFSSSGYAATIYVDADATTGSNSGADWDNAFTDLQDALTEASVNADPTDEIWVAEGIYYPGSARTDYFQLQNGVTLYGGFEGTELSVAGRDIAANPTILSGDIGTTGDAGDNSYHIFYHPSSLGLGTTAVMDGFTITGGNANGSSENIYGGGMYNNTAAPVIKNCRFIDNMASSHGGGIYNSSSSLTLIGCYFSGNQSGSYGGALYNNNSSPIIASCTFQDNSADNRGGAMVNLSSSDAVITNCTFSENDADVFGGALYNASSTPTIINSILWGNASADGNEIYNGSDGPAISYSIIEACGGSGAGWDSDLGTDGGNNSQINPDFIPNSELHISKDSPGINSGNDGAAPTGNDVDNETRSVNGIDIGADEFLDNDGDGLSDWVELNVFGTLADDTDTDDDGLTDGEEYHTYNSSPTETDTDGDGLSDFAEVTIYYTNPAVADPEADTDGDGVSNRDEIDTWNTDPSDTDSDDDSYSDGIEVWHGSIPDDAGSTPPDAIIYVNVGAAGANTGKSWANAYTDLQSALDIAADGDQIWVAAGTYYPTVEHGNETGAASENYNSFQLINGVAIYGGFESGDSSPDERDTDTNRTTLSGDNATPFDPSDDAYHVFYHPDGLGLNSTAILDGVSITKGHALVSTAPHGTGGGMYNYNASPTLRNCTFSDNYATVAGGGMYNINSSPTLTGCTFIANHVGYDGGGMYNGNSSPTLTDCLFIDNVADDGNCGGMYNNAGSPVLNGCTFSRNVSLFGIGGGMYNSGASSTLTNCTFSQNESVLTGGGLYNETASPTISGCTFIENSTHSGGGIHNMNGSPNIIDCTFRRNIVHSSGGGLYNENGSPVVKNCSFVGNTAVADGAGMYNLIASPILTNCVFSGNSAGSDGGGIYNQGSMSVSLVSCTFSGNYAAVYAGSIYNESSSSSLSGCILWGNTKDSSQSEVNGNVPSATFSYCNIEGSGGSSDWNYFSDSDLGHNIDLNPKFVRNPDAGDDDIWGTSDDDYGDLHLTASSPCIDAGDNSYNTETTDIDGEDRIVDGNTDGTQTIDIGADELIDSDGDGTLDYQEIPSVVTTVSSVVTSEAGDTAVIHVRLKSRPDGNVVIAVTSDDTSEGSVSVGVLTYTELNWNSDQTITVSGVDDNNMDDYQTYSVQLAVVDETTGDTTGYKGIAPVNLSFINTDDDSAGITTGNYSVNLSDSGLSVQFSIVLNSEPESDVTISIHSSDSAEAVVDPQSIVFTTDNWNTDQTVVVTVAIDGAVDGNKDYTIELLPAQSADAIYNGIDPDDITIVNTLSGAVVINAGSDADDESSVDTDTGNDGGGSSGGCFIGTL